MLGIFLHDIVQLQLYIGPSRSTVVQNRDVVKELDTGMLVATAGPDNFPRVGRVECIPPNPVQDTEITIQWMTQERAPRKPKWQRYFKFSPQRVMGSIKIQDITLYGFELTRNGCLRKKTREYLQRNL